MNWEGNNLQGYSMEKPKDDEREIVLELYCVNCKAVKDFTITNVLTNMWDRKTSFLEFGSLCMICNRKVKVKIAWKDKPIGRISKEIIGIVK
tara:strand:- start:1268 stop:1543 length:276 start_codon:yes stop_codon:yes gene_type:complete